MRVRTTIAVAPILAGALVAACSYLRREPRTREPDGGAKKTASPEATRPHVAYREPDATWLSGTLAWESVPVDVSFLNDRPAGKHGRVIAVGERLRFQDGTEARFWGVNVQANGLFNVKPPRVVEQARRLAALGFNLVRIHHHDSDWVTPNVFKPGNDTGTLDDAALEKLDYWIKCLTDEGIYVWLDLNVGRRFKPGDRIEGLEEVARGESKGFAYVNPRVEELMTRFADQYLGHQNRHTGLTYAADPAVVAVLLTNENDLTHHFGNLFLADKNNPVHQRLFEKLATGVAKQLDLPLSQSLRTWEAGPSKILLGQLEYAFDRRAIEHLRSIGYPGLVATTSYWGESALYSLPPLASGDIVDAHSYGEEEFLGENPRSTANFVTWIASAQVAGKPLSVTEWNVPYPARDRFVAPTYVASIAALQGWDAMMLYGYVQTPVEPQEIVDEWSAWLDPALMASMPAAALLYRRGDVSAAREEVRLEPSRDELYLRDTSPTTSAAVRTLAERSRLTIGLSKSAEAPWLSGSAPEGGRVVRELDRDFLPSGPSVVSDTGELERNWETGVQTIDTAKTKVVNGWVGGRSVRLHEVTFEVRTPKASVALSSLDALPLSESKRMLLTVVAQSKAEKGNRYPFRDEPVEGSVTLPCTGKIGVAPLLGTESKASAHLPAVGPKDGRCQIALPASVPSHWFELTR